MAAFDNTLRKFASLNSQRQQSFATNAAAVPGFARNASMTFATGTRVIDLVTGQQGTVTYGKRESITFSAAGVGSGGDGVREA